MSTPTDPIRPSRARHALYAALTALFVLAFIELVSFGFFTLEENRFAFANPSFYVLSPRRIRSLKGHFDPRLGWAPRYSTPHGERPRDTDYGRPFMASFGDSHTFGDEVGDQETWQTFLSHRLRADVYNFGVGGFGPDQALLRFREKALELPVSLVALGFGLENINRVVNRYRPFYARQTGVPYPKPRFVLRGSTLQLIPNPVQSPEELERLSHPDFVHQIGQEDFWYIHGDLPRLSFPYTRFLFSREVWRQARSRERRSENDPQPRRNLWKDEEVRSLFFAILDAFESDVEARGARPLLILEAGLVHVRAQRDGRGIPGYAKVLAHCQRSGYLCFDELIAFAEGTDRPIEEYFEPGGHPSPLGNAFIAEHLEGFLKAHHAQLLPRS